MRNWLDMPAGSRPPSMFERWRERMREFRNPDLAPFGPGKDYRPGALEFPTLPWLGSTARNPLPLGDFSDETLDARPSNASQTFGPELTASSAQVTTETAIQCPAGMYVQFDGDSIGAEYSVDESVYREVVTGRIIPPPPTGKLFIRDGGSMTGTLKLTFLSDAAAIIVGGASASTTAQIARDDWFITHTAPNVGAKASATKAAEAGRRHFIKHARVWSVSNSSLTAPSHVFIYSGSTVLTGAQWGATDTLQFGLGINFGPYPDPLACNVGEACKIETDDPVLNGQLVVSLHGYTI